jgi:hypothetical protein
MGDDVAARSAELTEPLHPHPEVDEWLEKVDEVLEETSLEEPQPEQTDNRPRPEDGDQSEVDQKIIPPPGSPS